MFAMIGWKTQFFKENPSNVCFFSVGQMLGSSHYAQKHVA